MLVLLLSLFSNYGLLHCYRTESADSRETPLAERIHKSVHEIDSLLKDFQLEIRKEKSVLRAVDQEIKDIGISDYNITSVSWVGSPGTLQTGINMTTTLFPTPEGHFTNATKDPWEKLNLPGIQANNSPFDVFEGFPNHGHVPDNDYQLDHTPFNPYLTYSPTETVFAPYYDPNFVPPTRPSYPFIVSTPATSSVPDHYFNYISFDTYSAGSPTYRLSTKTLLPRPAIRGSASTLMKGVTMSELYKKYMRDRTGYKPYRNQPTKANRLTTLPHRPRKLARTLSKAQAWVQNRQWLKTKKAGKSPQGHIRQGSGDPVDKPPIMEKPPEVENSPIEVKPAEVENSPVEKKPAEVENAPVEKAPDIAENPPIEKTPDNAKNSPIEKGPDTAENSPVGKTMDGNAIVYSPDSFGSFSMPALTDIIPSLSIPGMDELSLTSALSSAPTSPTAVDPLAIETTTIETAFTAELFQEDDQGFLFVSSPATIYDTTERTTNTIGQLLLHAENFTASTQAPLIDLYHQLMETRDEGYLMVFLLELSRMIAYKKSSDVASVMAHTESLYNEMYERGGLSFFGEEIIDLGTKFSRMFSGSNIGILQSHANMMNQMLIGRAEFLSVEVNSIIDYADMLYEDDEGESLFEALKMFEAFPIEGMSSRDLCRTLIENFIKPYRRLRSTQRLRKLIDSITRVVAQKFGQRRSGGAGIIPGVTIESHQSRKKQNQPQPLRRKLQMKRQQKFYRRDQPDNLFKRRRQFYTTEMMMRNLLPITKHQRRFHIITPRQLRSNGYLNIVRPTVQYLKRRLGSPVHPPNVMLQLFPQAKNVEYMKRAQTDEEQHHPEEFAKQQTLGTMGDEARRIVAESSYSDEEASLKMNLRHALRVNWYKTSTPIPSQ